MCSRCDRLLASYQQSVARYSEAARQLRGMLGDDFTRAFREVEELRTTCQDAKRKLLAHLDQAHEKPMPGG